MDEKDDIREKFNKLSNDYAKLRTQAQVLKKGVLNEQAKSKQLEEATKEYEQRVRKADLEMESLLFRNTQLTKRVIVLQEELDKRDRVKKPIKLSKKSGVADSGPPNPLPVMNEELATTILENANLLIRIEDQNVEMSLLKNKIEQLDRALDEIKSTTKQMVVEHEASTARKLIHSNNNSNRKTANNRETDVRIVDDTASIGSLSSFTIDDLTDVMTNGAATTTTKAQLTVIAREQIIDKQTEEIRELKQLVETLKAQVALNNTTDQMRTNLERVVEGTSSDVPLVNVHESLDQETDIEVVQAAFITQQITTREKQISEYFLRRINDCVSETDRIRSAWNDLQLEYNSLEARLVDNIDSKSRVETQLTAAEESLMHLQEELSTTSSNYDQQLSSMSDHLANMNETLTNQCDQIQQLQYELKMKSKK